MDPTLAVGDKNEQYTMDCLQCQSHVNLKNRNYNNLKIYNNMYIPVILKNNNLHNTTHKYSADL